MLSLCYQPKLAQVSWGLARVGPSVLGSGVLVSGDTNWAIHIFRLLWFPQTKPCHDIPAGLQYQCHDNNDKARDELSVSNKGNYRDGRGFISPTEQAQIGWYCLHVKGVRVALHVSSLWASSVLYVLILRSLLVKYSFILGESIICWCTKIYRRHWQLNRRVYTGV